ncbi:hypothetical protein RhiirC2_721504 [Rhizophagus irregularis]|uniref:Uncharacterized protein n=1 Tax=Rhizophagus irregularis TaxID=588596 RepID=A0A2N1M5Y6_9GLOM|nr:hypothetical protein RhiirC2_721504 [Rhizophagus irregularis]
MAQVFDNTEASRSTKKSGLITIRAKLGLLNLALHDTYGLKFKAIDKNGRHYHLVGFFDSKDAPRYLNTKQEKKFTGIFGIIFGAIPRISISRKPTNQAWSFFHIFFI